MLNKRFSLLFYLKKPQNSKQLNSPIYLRITVDAERIKISVQRSCLPSRWNTHSGRFSGTKEDARSLNAYLDTIQVKVYNIRRNLVDSDKTITAEIIKNELLGVRGKSRMILEIYQHHNEQLKELVGKDYSPTTLKRYQTSLEHTRNFIQWKYKATDFEIDKLNYEFISEYAF